MFKRIIQISSLNMLLLMECQRKKRFMVVKSKFQITNKENKKNKENSI